MGYNNRKQLSTYFLSMYISDGGATAADLAAVQVPTDGTVVGIRYTPHGTCTTGATITPKIGTTAITGGAIVVPNSSTIATAISVTPTAANKVVAGDIIKVTGGGGGTAMSGTATFEIARP